MNRAMNGVGSRGRFFAGSDVIPRHSEYHGVFRGELAVLFHFIDAPPQSASGHLLAEQLRAEGAESDHVRDGSGVPAFGYHPDADYAPHPLAGFPGLANGVQRAAKNLVVRAVRESSRVASVFAEARVGIPFLVQVGECPNRFGNGAGRVDFSCLHLQVNENRARGVPMPAVFNVAQQPADLPLD